MCGNVNILILITRTMNIHRLFFVAKYEHIILQKQTKKVGNFCNDFSVFFYILVIRAKALTEQDGKEVGEGMERWNK